MSRKKIVWIGLAVAALLCVVAWYTQSQATKPADNGAAANTQKYTHVDIEIRDSKLVGTTNTYLVNPGTGLEFSITSDKFGKVGVPTDPAQVITFTKSPLVFHFNAPQSGTYPMTFQADGSDEVLLLGTVTVRSAK